MSSISISSAKPQKLVATCPSCNTRYKIKANMSGRKAKCSKCQARMRIPTLRAKLNESDRVVQSNRASNSKLVSSVPGIKPTGNGILMVAWGVIISGLAASAAIGSQFLAIEELSKAYLWLQVAAGTGMLFLLTGLVLTCFVPRQTKAKGWAVSALVFGVGILGLGVYQALCSYDYATLIVESDYLNYAAMGLMFVMFFAYMFFIKNTAKASGRPELAATARGIMWIQLLAYSVLGGTIALASQGSSDLIKLLTISIVAAFAINCVINLVLHFQLGSHLLRRK